jgi:hypothetical protein
MTAMMPNNKAVRNIVGPIENEQAKQNFDYAGATKSKDQQTSASSGATPFRGKTVTKTSGMAQLLSPSDNSLKTTLG